LFGFADQDEAASRIDRPEIIGGTAGVASEAPDCRRIEVICVRIVVWCPKVKEVVSVNHIEQIDVPIFDSVGNNIGSKKVTPEVNMDSFYKYVGLTKRGAKKSETKTPIAPPSAPKPGEKVVAKPKVKEAKKDTEIIKKQTESTKTKKHK
jgi:hypothetical protein